MEHADGGDLFQEINKSRIAKEFIPEHKIWSYLV